MDCRKFHINYFSSFSEKILRLYPLPYYSDTPQKGTAHPVTGSFYVTYMFDDIRTMKKGRKIQVYKKNDLKGLVPQIIKCRYFFSLKKDVCKICTSMKYTYITSMYVSIYFLYHHHCNIHLSNL